MSDKSRRTRAVERLADALQECFDAAVDSGTTEAVSRLGQRMDRQDETLRALSTRMGRQDETLRMMWNQAKGRGTLPIDS